MTRKKILVTGTSVRKDLLQPLVDAGFEIENPTHLLKESELKERLKTAHGYLLGGDEFASKEALSEAKDLKLIAFLGMGYESFVDVTAATNYGIAVSNTPGTLSNSVAEFTVGMVLNATRKLYKYATDFVDGSVGKETKQHDLGALNIGILGLGGIGTRIAEVLTLGFNCKVSYYSRTRKESEEKRLNLTYQELNALLTSVDVLIVMTPATPETIGLLGSKELGMMKKDSVLVNTARPEIVDEQALLEALNSGSLGYACMDGFYESKGVELLKQAPNNLMVTGHIGSLTHEARDGMAIKATQSLINMLERGEDPYIVNQ